jgi:hypothetical protein
VTEIITEMSGPHLNSDVATLLMRTIPMFPIGHWVEVQTGKYRGWRGVVVSLAADALHQPTVRLLLDDRANRAATPVELDLKVHDGVKISGLAPGDIPFELGVAV